MNLGFRGRSFFFLVTEFNRTNISGYLNYHVTIKQGSELNVESGLDKERGTDAEKSYQHGRKTAVTERLFGRSVVRRMGNGDLS